MMTTVDIKSTVGGETVTDTIMLNEAINACGLKKSFIAKRLNLSTYGLSRKINNLSEFTASEIDSFCELLGISSLEKRFAIFFAKRVDK